jgi:MFS-type transporter involved in bile tolerance (Atg22 family)
MKYKNLNLKYALINATFMMLVCATAGYAYNFLSQSGFADGTVGIIITLISICGLIGQAIFGAASTCGGLLASAIGGQLFQYMNTSPVIMIGVIASCIDTVLMVICIRRMEA